MRLGFIGTGHITEAMVTGLCTLKQGSQAITVSARNSERAATLAARFPQVSIAPDNQTLLDRSDLVVLAVVPQIAPKVLAPLTFRSEHLVVSAMALCSLAQLAEWVAPARRIRRIIPMPPIARHLGPIALCPDDAQVAALFAPLGQVVAVKSEAELNALFATTALMAPFYALQEATTDWLISQDIDPARAKSYVTSLFHALSVEGADPKVASLGQLVTASQTPGGINQQCLRQLRSAGWTQAPKDALAVVLARLEDQVSCG